MARQTGVMDGVHQRMACQVPGHLHGIGFVLTHAYGQRFQTAEDQPAVEWTGYGPGSVLVELDRLIHVGVTGDHRAADDVRVSADVLGGAVHHDVGSQAEWTLPIGCGEGVIHCQDGLLRPGDLGHGGDIYQV